MGICDLPLGLKHVVVFAATNDHFPPVRDSQADIELLRAANLAMKRKLNGHKDDFLFLLPSKYRADGFARSIEEYGFPDPTLITLDDEGSPENLFYDEEALRDEIARAVDQWISRHHPGAIPVATTAYASRLTWWAGIEHADDVFDWAFSASQFESELPTSAKGRAETWLTVLGYAIDLHEIRADCRDQMGIEQASSYAATLCEWLHGFEAASGNDFNNFDPESVMQSLAISEVFLGFKAARLFGGTMEAFLDEYDCDLDDFTGPALKLVTADLRGEVRRGLSQFFEGNALLFFTLYRSVWARYGMRTVDSLDDLCCDVGLESFATLEAPLSLVSEGWCDAADD